MICAVYCVLLLGSQTWIGRQEVPSLARSQKLDGALAPRQSLRLTLRKYSGLLPLVTVALSGPEEALQWLLSQLLRYYFCGICGSELEGMALVTRGQNHFFRTPAPHHLFSYRLYWHGDAQKGHRGCCSSFMTHHFSCGQHCTEECAQAHERRMPPLEVLAWDRKAMLPHPRLHQRKGWIKQVSLW